MPCNVQLVGTARCSRQASEHQQARQPLAAAACCRCQLVVPAGPAAGAAGLSLLACSDCLLALLLAKRFVCTVFQAQHQLALPRHAAQQLATYIGADASIEADAMPRTAGCVRAWLIGGLPRTDDGEAWQRAVGLCE